MSKLRVGHECANFHYMIKCGFIRMIVTYDYISYELYSGSINIPIYHCPNCGKELSSNIKVTRT